MKKVVLGYTALLVLAGLAPVRAAEVATLPPAMYQQMKSGKKVARIWINPNFDTTRGFALGKVDSRSDEEEWAQTVSYLRQALTRLEFADSPYSLSVNIVELDPAVHNASDRTIKFINGTVAVEGLLTDGDGTIMLAFTAREKNDGRESVLANRQAAIDRIVWGLSRDLGPQFQKALEARMAAAPTPAPRTGPLLAPPPAADPLDVQGRLLQLDALRKQGLITAEEYQAHKAKILSGQ